MNKLATIITLGGLLTAATVQAQVDIYITGATAFRANAYRSIRALYGANLSQQNPAHDASGKNQVTWVGTIPVQFGSQTVTIRASYSGSAAGVQALAQNLNVTFLTSGTAGVTNTMTHVADLAFSDVFQTTTAYLKPALSDATVGVQPFTYTKSMSTPAGVTNITIQQLQSFMSAGASVVSYFTGKSGADDTTPIYLVGRDSSSGTRLTAQADAMFIGDMAHYATNGTCTWVTSPGYSSGGAVATVLNSGCGAAIGYVGVADAVTVNSGANILAYNGVKPFVGAWTGSIPDWTPVIKGQYSFWSYEHLFARVGAAANVTTFRTALKTEINNDLATSTSAIQTGAMKASREADGGPITPL